MRSASSTRIAEEWQDDGTGSAATLPASILQHGQSTLPDGRVLVSGGYGANCYIYMPSSNTWTEVASLPARIYWHGQSTLNDGRVMVSGGYTSGFLNTVYIYRFDDNRWEEVASLPVSLRQHGQTTLTDGSGKILVSAGTANNSTGLNTVYSYNISNNRWDVTASLPSGFWALRQSCLLNGKVLVTGGYNGERINTTYIYTPTGTGSWIAASPMPTGFDSHGQSALADGRVLVSAGQGNGSLLNQTYIYTPNDGTGTWADASDIPIYSRDHGQSTLADGRVLVSGGSGGGNTAYIYTPTGWVVIQQY